MKAASVIRYGFYHADGDPVQQASDDFHAELEKVKNIDLIRSAADRAKNSATGAIAGAAVGFGIGLILRRGMIISIILCSIAGGYIGSTWNMNLKKTKENLSNDDTENEESN